MTQKNAVLIYLAVGNWNHAGASVCSDKFGGGGEMNVRLAIRDELSGRLHPRCVPMEDVFWEEHAFRQGRADENGKNALCCARASLANEEMKTNVLSRQMAVVWFLYVGSHLEAGRARTRVEAGDSHIMARTRRLLEWSNQGQLDGQGKWHTSRWREIHKGKGTCHPRTGEEGPDGGVEV